MASSSSTDAASPKTYPRQGLRELLTRARTMGALILDKHDETALIVARMTEALLLYKASKTSVFCCKVYGLKARRLSETFDVNPIYLMKLAQGLRAGAMGSEAIEEPLHR
ncbi:hypothetical protein DL767_002738 [Monosporascus sp. MG133]|nr:hypothetical protein DL767_002738 [Monosporascus sp. MG133]